MKKVFIGVCMAAVLTLGTTSCGSGDKTDVNNDSIVSSELSDSINIQLGTYAGMDLGNRLAMAEKDGIPVNRAEFLKGLKFTISYPYSKVFHDGVQNGVKLAMTINRLKDRGVEINRDEILTQTRKYVMDDKFNISDRNATQLVFERLMDRLEALNGQEIAAEVSDSINTYLGMYAGMDLGSSLSMAEDSGIKINRPEFLKGLQLVIAHDHSNAYLNGAQSGLDLAMMLDHFSEAGVEINRDAVLEGINKYVTADSIDMTEMHKVQVTYEKLINRLENTVNNRLRMREGLEPVKAENHAENEADAESLFASEMVPGQVMTIDTGDGTMSATVKKSPSGLIYAIFDEGTGEKIGMQTQALIEYRGMHADGSSFDQNEATFAPAQVIPGFGEGLMMLAKGGKAMFRIPGELGYGAQGVPQAGIKPNETLYFMVYVTDIK